MDTSLHMIRAVTRSQPHCGYCTSVPHYSLEKPPSVSEMIDVAEGLELLGTEEVTEEVTEEIRDVLLPFLMKTDRDRRHLMLRSGFQHLLDDGKLYAGQIQSLETGDAA